MKKIITLCLTAGMLLGVATGASAIDFKAKGQWVVGFGMLDTYYQGLNGGDTFAAMQRVRLQLDAIASENLSGTVSFEMGDTTWGQARSGGALGADGTIVELRNAYIDWMVPNTQLSFRMGIQPLTLPSVAGGSVILDEQVAAVVASYKINDMASIGFAWARPFNDNWDGNEQEPANYLDNVDLFTVFVPLKGDNWKFTPWVLGGVVGKNAAADLVFDTDNNGKSAYYSRAGLIPSYALNVVNASGLSLSNMIDDAGYATAFFAGLPFGLNIDAFNFELDINYGSITGLGSGRSLAFGGRDLSLDRRGWLVKALFEYKMDWGTPGLFAWYGSGDDGDIENGSEMMPYLSPTGNFTSFIGDGNELGYSYFTSGNNNGYDQMLNYSGTWGVGLQLKNVSFIEDLSHTFRVAYWGGTNSTDMAKYVGNAFADVGGGGFYLTTSDYLVEFNLDTTYQIYENLQAVVQLGYIINGVSEDTWDFVGNSETRRDGYKAGVFFNYSF